MTKHELALSMQNADVHYNCAQIVLSAFGEELGLTREQCCALAANFGGGMGCGSMCGAITGALMAMGGMGLPMSTRSELYDLFRKNNGHLHCADLIKAAAERGEPKRTHCDRVILECVDFVCKQINKE